VVLDSTDGYFLVRFDFKRVIVMNDWQMLTLVGRDQEGIVAAVTEQLSKNGCQLGETSMMRLGGNVRKMSIPSKKAVLCT